MTTVDKSLPDLLTETISTAGPVVVTVRIDQRRTDSLERAAHAIADSAELGLVTIPPAGFLLVPDVPYKLPFHVAYDGTPILMVRPRAAEPSGGEEPA